MQDAHLNAVIITVNLMSVVGEVPQAFIVHRENPRHSCPSKNLSLLKKNSACKGCNYHLLACFIFRWGRRRRGWVAQFGAAMWSGLKYNSYTQPGKRATLPYGSSLHSCPSFWRLKIRIPGKQLRNIKFLMISKIPNMDQTDPCLLANSKSHVKPHRSN